MNKYIRTKDGVFKIEKEDLTKYYVKNNNYCIDELTKVVICGAYKKTDKEIMVASTIEELCDCFVVIRNKHTIWDKQHCLGLTFEQVKQSYSAYDFEIYGAIWTDKGLIYVAKMNEKGELELI